MKKVKLLDDEIINELNQDLNINIIKVEVMNKKDSNVVWLVSDGVQKYILRERTKTSSFIKNIFYKTAFISEVALYHNMNLIEWDDFCHPKLIKTDYNRYMVLEYIESVDKAIMGSIEKENLVRGLIEFQQQENITLENINIITKFLIKTRMNVTLQTFRWIVTRVRRKYGNRMALQSIFILIKSRFAIRGIKPLNQHNDFLTNEKLKVENIIIGENNECYFIDFETFVKKSNWIFLDIVDISWNVNSIDPNAEMLELYFKQLKRYYDYSRIETSAQFRIALMRSAYKKILSPSFEESKKHLWETFLVDILLNDLEYGIWFNENVKCYL